MGSNNNKQVPGQSGNDPRGRSQNMVAQQQQRYESQQGPLANAAAYNYGRGSEANYGDYTDIMNQYRNIASGGGTMGEGGGGGGGGGGETGFAPELIGYKDPFNSYAGFTRFGDTGGYSAQDMANLRARGMSPIRAAYGNAEREIQRQRSLQGGYSPNAIAAQVKMARESGQSMADAVQNVEGGIVDMRNKNMLAGYTGMSDIEKQRLAADLEVAKYNAQAKMSAAASASAAAGANADRAASANAAAMGDRFRALQGMTQLYGTTPGMAETFGNQAMNMTGQGGTFGLGLLGREREGQSLPGQFDQNLGRTQQMVDLGGRVIYGINEMRNQNRPPAQQQMRPAPGQTWDYSDQYYNG